MRHSVVRETPIISSTLRTLMNCTAHLRVVATSTRHVGVQAEGQRDVRTISPQVPEHQQPYRGRGSYE
jgi:hypothetical protein